MPRNYKDEYRKFHKSSTAKKDRAARNKAARSKGTKGTDQGHVKPLAHGGARNGKTVKQSVSSNRAQGARITNSLRRSKKRHT